MMKNYIYILFFLPFIKLLEQPGKHDKDMNYKTLEINSFETMKIENNELKFMLNPIHSGTLCIIFEFDNQVDISGSYYEIEEIKNETHSQNYLSINDNNVVEVNITINIASKVKFNFQMNEHGFPCNLSITNYFKFSVQIVDIDIDTEYTNVSVKTSTDFFLRVKLDNTGYYLINYKCSKYKNLKREYFYGLSSDKLYLPDKLERVRDAQNYKEKDISPKKNGDGHGKPDTIAKLITIPINDTDIQSYKYLYVKITNLDFVNDARIAVKCISYISIIITPIACIIGLVVVVLVYYFILKIYYEKKYHDS